MKLFRRLAGEILLTVLPSLFVGGCVIGIVDVDGNEGSWDKEATLLVSRTVPVSNQIAIRVLGFNGEMSVVGMAGAEEVSIRATKRVRSHSVADAEDHLSDIQLRIQSTPTEIRVETVQPDQTGNRVYAVDYEITVPETFGVAAVNGNGNLALEDLHSDVRVDLGNGNVDLRRLEGSARVAVGNGNLVTSLFLPDGGEIVFSVGNGTAVLNVQAEVSAEFRAQVGNGTIVVSGLTLQDAVSGPNTLRGTLGTGAGLIDLTVGNGNIQMKGG